MQKAELSDAEYILILETAIDKLTKQRDEAKAALAAAERRGMERAAGIADKHVSDCEWTDGVIEAGYIAAAIRADMEKTDAKP